MPRVADNRELTVYKLPLLPQFRVQFFLFSGRGCRIEPSLPGLPRNSLSLVCLHVTSGNATERCSIRMRTSTHPRYGDFHSTIS